MGTVLQLPIIDLSLPEKLSTSRLIRQACLDHGFFYLTNHGVSEELMEGVFRESKNLFSLPLDEKMVMARRGFRGYSPVYDEKLESSSTSKGDPKEIFTFGSWEGVLSQLYPNEWPSEDLLPLWRPTMECYYKTVMDVGRKLLGLVALALNMEENFFERVGAFNDQAAVVRLLRYPGELNSSEGETCGASPHSDFGMITLLATDGVPGLQICRDKDKEPRVWEDVPGIKGAFVVNIGDLMERWSNGIFRSTMHRVLSVGKERYSVAVFLDPDPNCVVECLESCCSETSPPRRSDQNNFRKTEITKMETSLLLPIIDISSPDKRSTAQLIRRACLDHGFFYVKNHGISEELMEGIFRESKTFFNLPLEEKMALLRGDMLGYSPLNAEKLDPSLSSTGDSKESFHFGSWEGVMAQRYPNKWPPEDLLPSWRQTMECYYKNVLSVGSKLLGLIALALDIKEDFFEQVGALNDPTAVVRLLRYPGEVISSDVETYGASAHSDYGMVTLLTTDGVPGLQVCRDKSKQPRIWEDVPGVRGAFIVNIGDMMERWTNGLFRSTLHRVMPVGKERYSVVFFLIPNPDCNVECLESCCSETCPPRFPPILAGDYIKERFRLTFANS